MAGVIVTVRDVRHDTEEQIEARARLSDLLTAEVVPDAPPTDLAQAVAAHRARPDHVRRIAVEAHDPDGTLVGVASTAIDDRHDDNPDTLEAGVAVHPDHRRRGIGTTLLAAVVELARSEGRTRLFANTMEAVPAGRALATSLGATEAQRHHVNHLPIEVVDRPMLERWVAEAAERAADYELVAFDGPCPDEHMDGFIGQVLVLNTAPRDGIQVNDFTLTPAQVREREAVQDAAGIERWTVLARHRASGAYAGLHDLSWNPADPTVVWVGLTAVDPTHRGHALGKWLKAALTLRVLDERPDVTEIRTGNADSNDAMLGINRAMGYRPMIAMSVWELATDDAAAWVAARTAGRAAGTATTPA